MGQERFKRIASILERDELTLRERQFVEAIKKCFNEKMELTAQQESILDGIYKEKTRMRKAF